MLPPLPTRTNQLCARAGEWTVVLYPYIEGEMGWATMSDEHWKARGASSSGCTEAPLPTAGFEGVRKEAFDPSEYARSLASQVACPRGEQEVISRTRL